MAGKDDEHGPLGRAWLARGHTVTRISRLHQPELVTIGDWFTHASVPAEAVGADREAVFRCLIHELELRRGWRGLAARLRSWGL
jgi:hypothetical protein